MVLSSVLLPGIISIIVIVFYRTVICANNYWKKRNVPFIKALPIFGNLLDAFLFRCSFGELLRRLYKQIDAPFFGIYVLARPGLLIKDTKVIQSILVKDFDHFCNRNLLCDETTDLMLSKMLPAIKQPAWRPLRTKITPIFTSVKIKNMWNLLNVISEEMNDFLSKPRKETFVEVKDLSVKYMTDVITSFAFGINANSFQSENSQFLLAARKMFEFNWKTALSQSCYFMAHTVVKMLKLRFFDEGIITFMRKAFAEAVIQRETNKQIRNDLVDIIIQMKTDDVRDDEDQHLVAHAVQFFSAGFETTSTTMAFTLYELCLNTHLQSKLRAEVQSVVAKHGGLTYDAINEMKFLSMVVYEALRKHPPLTFLDRECVKDYKIPNSDLVVEKDTSVFISVFALHYDPAYFPDPDKFDPERFSDENKSSIVNCSYLAFGSGPRGCIGERFGFLTVKLGVASIISEFELERCETTPVPVQYETKSFFLGAAGGLPIKFKKL